MLPEVIINFNKKSLKDCDILHPEILLCIFRWIVFGANYSLYCDLYCLGYKLGFLNPLIFLESRVYQKR